MARIRSIKPELRTSLTVADWPREVRYLWVLLWGYLDDHGRGVDDARLVKADCLPLDDDITRAIVDGWLDTIATAGPLCRYQVDGRRYLHVPSWKEHQRPSHPGDSRVPPCPVHDCPDGPPETLAKDSGGPPEDLAPEQGAGSREQVVRAGSREQGSAVADAREPRAARATRIPDDFTVSPEMVAWAAERTPHVDGRLETEKFVNYWRAKSGSAATKLDWPATWRNWMLTAAERAPNGRASPGSVVALHGAARPSTSDQRVAAGLALAAKYDALDDQEERHDAR